MAVSRTRSAIVFVVVTALALGGFFAVRAIVRAVEHHFTSEHCTVGDYELDVDQASVAAQMVGAVAKFEPPLPAHAGVLVLMAGLQESKLHNLAPGEGDRDSVGVLQQRPSQNWGGGDANRLTDVTEATREFLAALVKVHGWKRMSPAAAIQAVQVSADGSAYAKHEDEARALAAALGGARPAGITCTFDKPTKVASARKVVALLRHQLPVNPPQAHGSTIRVPGAGWQTAAWFVANAWDLGIDSVDCRGKRWTRSGGWTDVHASAQAVVATLASV